MEHIDNLRLQDLIAKTSGVHMSNVVKVLTTLQLLADAMGIDETDLYSEYNLLELLVPDDDNIAACNMAYNELLEYAIEHCQLGKEQVTGIKGLKTIKR